MTMIWGRNSSDEDHSDMMKQLSQKKNSLNLWWWRWKKVNPSDNGTGRNTVIFLWHNIKISTGPQEKFCNVYGLQFKTSSTMDMVDML